MFQDALLAGETLELIREEAKLRSLPATVATVAGGETRMTQVDGDFGILS